MMFPSLPLQVRPARFAFACAAALLMHAHAAPCVSAAGARSAADSAGAIAAFAPHVRRVVFLGDSITHAGAYLCAVEAYMITRHPERAVEIINLGLPSETVSGLSEAGHANGKFPRPDLHERLARVLAQTKPDLVIACYGMNDGIYEPFADERYQKFQAGMRRLHEAVERAGAKIIHVTPPVFDESRNPVPGYNAVLFRYSNWLVAQAADGWTVIDAHAAMEEALAGGRETQPTFTFAKDGVHPDAAGHWIIARAILVGLGGREVATMPDVTAALATHPRGAAILELVTQRQAIMKLAWLSATGHTRPGVKAGLPLAAANAKAAEFGTRLAAMARQR